MSVVLNAFLGIVGAILFLFLLAMPKRRCSRCGKFRHLDECLMCNQCRLDMRASRDRRGQW